MWGVVAAHLSSGKIGARTCRLSNGARLLVTAEEAKGWVRLVAPDIVWYGVADCFLGIIVFSCSDLDRHMCTAKGAKFDKDDRPRGMRWRGHMSMDDDTVWMQYRGTPGCGRSW